MTWPRTWSSRPASCCADLVASDVDDQLGPVACRLDLKDPEGCLDAQAESDRSHAFEAAESGNLPEFSEASDPDQVPPAGVEARGGWGQHRYQQLCPALRRYPLARALSEESSHVPHAVARRTPWAEIDHQPVKARVLPSPHATHPRLNHRAGVPRRRSPVS